MAEKKVAAPEKSVFEILSAIDVNGHVEKKNGLTYLTWAWAWAEVKKRYPDATYTIYKDEHQRPYMNDPELGIMCFTTVTIKGETLEMWLPVMDGANNALKVQPYSIKTKYGEKPVAAANMFDINKTIMRCLVKNLAMFGLGHYIYAGEDLPEEKKIEAEQTAQAAANRKAEARKALTACKSIAELDAFIQNFPEFQNDTPTMTYINNQKAKLAVNE